MFINTCIHAYRIGFEILVWRFTVLLRLDCLVWATRRECLFFLKRHAVVIKQLTGTIVPVGSGKNKQIRYSKNHNTK